VLRAKFIAMRNYIKNQRYSPHRKHRKILEDTDMDNYIVD
jgi:hypothetical protein